MVTAAGDQPTIVRTYREREDAAFMPAECMLGCQVIPTQIPESDRLVRTSSGQPMTVRTDCHLVDPTCRVQDARTKRRVFRRQVPKLHRFLIVCRCQPTAVGRESDRGDPPFITG